MQGGEATVASLARRQALFEELEHYGIAAASLSPYDNQNIYSALRTEGSWEYDPTPLTTLEVEQLGS